MSALFVDYIKILGKGRHGSRSLTQSEAEQAMALILKGEVAPEQMGAFWMLIRIREETAEEAAGFTDAVRKHLAGQSELKAMSEIQIDLDWPAYAGKRNELPWFLLVALALAQSGIKVAMHGHRFDNDARIYVDSVIREFSIPTAANLLQAQEHIERHNFSYLPLEDLSPELTALMDLKRLLGLRSPVNTVVRLMNPTRAKHSVHGVFHTGYDELHIATAKLLNDESVLVFRGGNGEAEVNPEREVSLGLLKAKTHNWNQLPKASAQHIRQKNNLDVNRLRKHWNGEKTDAFGELAILHTMASILGMINNETDLTVSQEKNLQQAVSVWENRDKRNMLLTPH